MGKGHKNRKPQPASARPATAAPVTSVTRTSSARGSLRRTIAFQFVAILGLSAALGYVFNAANPIGVRFNDANADPGRRTPALTNLQLLSASTVVTASANAAQTSRPVATPQYPDRPIARPAPPLPAPLPSEIVTAAPPTTATITIPVPPAVASPPPATNPAPIHWLEAKPLAASGRAVLVDVRPRAVYDAGHIPNAVSMPETSSSEEFTAFLKLVPTNTELIVYCASTSCSMSKRVADRLVQQFNYSPVKYMTGGYQEYQQEELAKPQQPPVDR